MGFPCPDSSPLSLATATPASLVSLRPPPQHVSHWILIAVFLNILLGFVAPPRSYGEAVKETFIGFVENERLRVCTTSPTPGCDSDFEVIVLFAQWLDSEEERAVKLEELGDDKAARELRFAVLQYAALLDICMDQIKSQHRQK
jgi:hypothetical protein